MRIASFIFLLTMIAGCKTGTDVDPLTQNAGAVPVITAYIDEEDYLSLLENRFSNVNVPILFGYRDQKYNGSIEPQGAGTRMYARWSYRIHLTDGSSVEGLTDFNLGAQITDRSMLRTEVASALYRAEGFPVFSSNYALLSLNSHNEGLYLIIERIDSAFYRRRAIPLQELVKVGFGSHFSFNVPNYPPRNFSKEIPDDANLNNLSDLIHALDITPDDQVFTEISKYLNIPEYLRYHAMTSVIRAQDNFHNNFYLYKTFAGEPYHTQPWDFDLSFEADAKIAFYGENEIITKLLKNDSCFALYKAGLEHIVNDVFTEEKLYPLIDSLSSAISGAYSISPWHGGIGRTQSVEAEKLKSFIRERRDSLMLTLPEFKK